MRQKLASGLIAALLATGIGMVVVPAPARADVCPDYQVCSPSPDAVVSLAFIALKIGKGGLTAEALEALFLQLNALLQSTKNEVIAHSDALEVRKAIERLGTLLIEAQSYPVLRENEFTAWDFYHNTLSAVDENIARFNNILDNGSPTSGDLKNADDVARAINAEFPLVDMAVGGWSELHDPVGGPQMQRALEERYINTEKAIRTKLEPRCHREGQYSDSYSYSATVVCTAATGRVASRPEYLNKTTGTWVIGPVSVPALMKESAIGSAWLEATMVLEHLGIL